VRPRIKELHLPRCVYERRGKYFFVTHGKWIPLGETIDQDVLAALSNQADRPEIEAHLKRSTPRLRQGAKDRGLCFEVSAADLVQIVAKQSWLCALSGLPFSFERAPGIRILPYAPSVDRIDNTAGYSTTNCRVVLACVNLARNCMSDTLFQTVAKSIANH
jgi:hypothetical protein